MIYFWLLFLAFIFILGVSWGEPILSIIAVWCVTLITCLGYLLG